MYPLFESISIVDGKIQNPSFHEARFAYSYFNFFKKKPPYKLFTGITLPKLDTSLQYKLRIAYSAKGTDWTITPYTNKLPRTLQLVENNTIAYPLKYNDRSSLDILYGLRRNADDVLICSQGNITDASYSNILFTNGITIVTPATPLLKGTCRARLLATNLITETSISINDLQHYTNFQLINALNDFDPKRWVDLKHIYLPK